MLHDEWLKSLPVPTVEQTARFADHVADNHSWYKHLPFFPPGALFVFFPNMNAGRGVNVAGDRHVPLDIGERGNYFAHHSCLPTVEYLAQFGHWDYWVDDNPRVSDPVVGPPLYSADGCRRELLPYDRKQQWSCRLTAFLRPSPAMFNLRPGELQREADAFIAADRPSLGRLLRGLFRSPPVEDPARARYRPVAAELRRATGTWWNQSLHPFVEFEAREQREEVLNTLHRIREVWADS